MKDDHASSTAYTVLQGMLFAAKKAGVSHLVTDETVAAARTILSVTDEGQKRLRQLDSGFHRGLLSVVESLLLPGISTHYALRKKFIRDAVEQAIQDGHKNVVNLGAGFDTTAFELHSKHKTVTFFELDHPATSAHKVSALKGKIADNLHFQAVDFSKTSAKDVLSAHPAFDPSHPTIFICEGVLMYLDVSDVQSLFAGLKELSSGSCRLVFSCVAPMRSRENNCGPLLRLYLRVKGEPLNWHLLPEQLADFVAAQSYQLLDHAGTDELKRRYLAESFAGTLHRGEFLALTSSQ